MKTLLLAAAAILIVLSGGLIYGGNFANSFINEQLAAQKITFPSETKLKQEKRDDLLKYADQQVNTGAEAKAYSSYIEGHLSKIANGQSYSEVSAQYQKDKSNQTLKDQREQLFMGEMLRGTLLSVWGWSLIGVIALYSGIALLIVAISLLAIFFISTEEPKKKSVKSAKSKKRK